MSTFFFSFSSLSCHAKKRYIHNKRTGRGARAAWGRTSEWGSSSFISLKFDRFFSISSLSLSLTHTASSTVEFPLERTLCEWTSEEEEEEEEEPLSSEQGKEH